MTRPSDPTRAERSGPPVLPLAIVVTMTGASALALQVVWQRVISMHSGVDLVSSTTVVAGFLLGLGTGSLLGGLLADRLGPDRSLLGLAAANAGVGVFAWFSTALFYDLYREVASDLTSRPAAFAFNVALLLVPTTLEGLSLPLVARVVARDDGAPAVVARLYGVNTIGAAAGAFVCGWILMGEFGFVAATRIAAVTNLAAATLLLVLYRRRSTADTAAPEPDTDTDTLLEPVPAVRRRVAGWYATSALFGAVALAFEQVHFRLVDAIGRSNSYSFSLVLAMYLGTWGLGAAIGSRLLRRVRDRRAWYLWLQFASGFAAAVALIVVVRLAPHIGLGSTYDRWFNGDGFAGGYPTDQWGDVALFALVLPALLMGIPILLLGTAYPFVQAIVADELATVGRRTGALGAANILGSVGGTLVSGFVLIDLLGTAGTFRLLCAVLAGAGVVAVALRPGTRAQVVGTTAVVALLGLVVWAPGNHDLWSFLVGSDPAGVDVAEDHSCASVFERYGGQDIGLVINGASQNGHPYDDFHVLIGLLPVLLQDDPDRALSIGFGIGSTTYAQLSDPRLGHSTTVELCGGNYELARRAAADIPDFERILDDPRSDLVEGDGRRHLLVDDTTYDAIVVDTLRPTSANAGSHYSVEMMRLAASRLTDHGIYAQWAPSALVLDAAPSAFPYVVAGTVDDYNGSVLLLGSRSPITVDHQELLRRFDDIASDRFDPDQTERLRRFLRTWAPRCINDGTLRAVPDRVNRDLAPSDEYPLNRLSAAVGSATSACRG